ncbi:lysM domain-containing GPI-anchored protein LYP4 [Selaginella moellendorffii]|uniref:lysM domain-containing GPI-anchored protein LYP4 n=1 Tax=Selaginella moellendorffii TaxID=88036 RepID=UPI000D1CFB63|nr:lysM domain-containing GPI-anchored protein LYP4 [Selaginella moellendorffii]|eukprot:XP_024522069.1 lysM domain-containing GPI-anchored protein LYP4 [Selaginella moellendorffii]
MAPTIGIGVPILIVLLLGSIAPLQLHAASFNESCRATVDPPCQALLAYRSSSLSPTIANISSLFSIPVQAILAANAFSPSDDPSARLSTGETLRIPVPCSCAANGQRSGNTTYTIAPGDFLFQIANNRYGGLVTIEEIAAANGIVDLDKILAGQNLTIPYPCSCRGNSFGGRDALFMAYVVQDGESREGFYRSYNLSQEEFDRLNPSVNVSQAGAVIELPVPACRARFNRSALDSNLTVASGGYAITANGCVQCNCDGTELHCTRAPTAPRNCSLGCRNSRLQIGNFSTGANSSGGCTIESCLYDGYNNRQIFTRIERNATSGTCGDVQAPPSFAYAPEGDGIPEAFAPSSLPGAEGIPPPTPGAGSNSPGQTAPPPSSSSIKISIAYLLPVVLSGLSSIVLYTI